MAAGEYRPCEEETSCCSASGVRAGAHADLRPDGAPAPLRSRRRKGCTSFGAATVRERALGTCTTLIWHSNSNPLECSNTPMSAAGRSFGPYQVLGPLGSG